MTRTRTGNVTPFRRSGLDETHQAERRRLNALRFQWHERVLRDAALTPGALRFAGVIMHRYRVNLGYAEVSHRAAAKLLGVAEKTALRGRDLLQARGYLHRLNGTSQATGRQPRARYALGEGPEDGWLVVDAGLGDDME